MRHRNLIMALSLLCFFAQIAPGQTNDMQRSTMYPPINDMIPGFSAVPGDYEATRATIPLGPYHMSFSTRLENVTFEGKYDLMGYNETAGSGKNYDVCDYDIGFLRVLRNSSAQRYDGGYGYPVAEITFTIYRYIGPLSYPAVNPDPNGFSAMPSIIHSSTVSHDYIGPDSLTIDGKPGTLITWWTIYHHENVVYPSESFDSFGEKHYIAAYQPNDRTFVVIEFDGIDYDKDVSLVLETLHITETYQTMT